MGYRFVILRRPSGFFMSIRHENGQVLWHSEAYTGRASAIEPLHNFIEFIKTSIDKHPSLSAAELLAERLIDEEPEPAVEVAAGE